MKNLNDALDLRNYFLQVMEQATKTKDEQERKKLLTIVIAGAGPTGVEVSGMLAEMKNKVVRKDYPELTDNGHESHIYLVDSSSNVLSTMSEKSQVDCFHALEKMGVEIKLGMQVKDYVNDTVLFANGERIETQTLVWATGVTSSVFEGVPEESNGRGKRLLVNAYNEVKGLQDVFAIGDTCL